MRINKIWISEHLDEVEGLLQVLDEATGGSGVLHEAEIIGAVAIAGMKMLLGAAPAVTQAEVDGRIAELRSKLRSNDGDADTSLASRFPAGDDP
jgi:hypothetical protein